MFCGSYAYSRFAAVMGAISLVDKDGLRCADIVDPHKLAGIPELSTLHELLQRIARFTRAGRSISSGGGTQAGGFRAHFRIVPHSRHSTPGTMEWGHLDSVCSLRVASAAKRLYASDPQNTCAACHPPAAEVVRPSRRRTRAADTAR